MKKEQDGMTLVEVLATLVISSFIIMLIWTTIAISMKYNVVENKKLKMQQEANYIISAIQETHRKASCYSIIQENTTWEIEECNGNVRSTFNSSQFNISISAPSGYILTKPSLASKREGEYYSDYPLYVSVSDKQNKELVVSINSTISRYDEEY